MIRIRTADGLGDLAAIRTLFEEYAASIGFDLSFQNFTEELVRLPGEYAPPEGCLLLAVDDAAAPQGGGGPAGCVALRRLSPEICEMKRLYVRPAHRGSGAGRLLAEAIILEGRRRGYAKMRLDTVPAMERARSLYRALGFTDIPAYRFNPIPGTLYMEMALSIR